LLAAWAGKIMQYKHPISALIVIYTSALEVLLLERADHPGAWQSVTGSQDKGEAVRNTAIREVFEETGLNAANYLFSDWQTKNVYEIYALWRHRYAPGTLYNTEHVFGLELPDRLPVQLSPREHLNYKWVLWQEAAELVFSPSNRAAILQLPERMRANKLSAHKG